MIKFEPNFRIAEDAWKLDHLATDIYFNWARARKENHTLKQEVKPKVEEGLKKCRTAPSLFADLSTKDSKRTRIDIVDQLSANSTCMLNNSF